MNVEATGFQPFEADTTVLGTDPIPTGPYYRADYFELEKEAVFKRTWLQIGHLSEIAEPGSFMVRQVEVAKASILITHGKDGKVRAFHNVCTHRGTQLLDEGSRGVRSSFTCRYHAWTFGYDGELRSAPDFERFYVAQEACALRPVAVEVCAKLIFINLDPAPAQSLREFLGPIAEKLETLPVAQATTFSEYVYELDANWKLAFDNFQEVYHLRFIHPRTGAAAGGPENPFGYPAEFRFEGLHRGHRYWNNPNPMVPPPIQAFALGKAIAFTAQEAVTAGPNSREYFALFPNFFVQGSPFMNFSHCIMPISPTRSRGVIRLYWVGKDDSASERFAREYATVSALDVHAEDCEIIEAGQRGVSSGAIDHIHFQSQEVLCRHLFHGVDKMVQAYLADRQSAGEIA